MAGGHKPPDGGFGGIYVNTTHASLGDLGSRVLPRAPSNTSWVAGGSYEVSWTIEANHGGGYSYRLAPADGPLDEQTFGRIPLTFVGKQRLRWRGGRAHGGLEIAFDGTYTTSGTTPAGSMWAKNPIPRNDMGQTGVGFAPPCAAFGMDASMCSGMEDGRGGSEPTLEIVDMVHVPADLPPGEYVLGWRWDCEESNQIWQSCSDLTVTAK
uniref:Chitin-binding type-4 domain-containing protein n=1 Tax=Haptolina brevifila TaxID=156173 RepID=A0A7S2FV91_9EUKA|mmetsp:Transcript_20060/g.40838  ORF Transcript_20060/g.40838 Transcript_20060/m.40838 type:complete len:210 (+) Transcript_20060:656-1285(+)